MRTHGLVDEKMDGTIKYRLVCGKHIRDPDNIDWGIPVFAPTIDMKLFYLMLSLCLQFEMEFEVVDIKGAYFHADIPREGLYTRVDPVVAAEMVRIRPKWVKHLQLDWGTVA